MPQIFTSISNVRPITSQPNFLPHLACMLDQLVRRSSPFCTATASSTISESDVERIVEGVEQPKNALELLKSWGCSEDDMSRLLKRRPSLRRAQVDLLKPKLQVLSWLGLTSSDLVKVINCRPRFLSCRINNCFDERLHFFVELFESRETLRKALVRNPSLLTYDFHKSIKPVISLYEGMGVSRRELRPMLISRPTLIPRTSFNEEKREYIQKTGVSKGSNMYKYVVCLIGISQTETIRAKISNIVKFGISEDEVWSLVGHHPLILTLSVDKVQRNMTFVVGTMKLPPNVILQHPPLLFLNLEVVIKPRVLLARKIEEMDLSPQIKGPLLFTALRMKEDRFLRAFITLHQKDIANELMMFYQNAKRIKRLAEGSKKKWLLGFPY